MRILHVAQPHYGGVAVYVRDLAQAQQRAGHEVVIACPPLPGPIAELTEDGASGQGYPALVSWPAHRTPWRGVASESRRLRAIVAAHDPEVIHLHAAKAGLIGRLVVRGRRPTIVQPHAWSFASAGRVRPVVTAWERWATRWTDQVICVSRGEAEAGLDAGVAGCITVVPNGVDLERFGAPAMSGARSPAPGLGDGPLVATDGLGDGAGPRPEGPTVVCVGRLCEQKGQDVLLSAWRVVVRDHPTARLWLVGDGPDRAVLEERARGLPQVRFAGWQDDVPAWLSAADLVVMSSRWEGMALTLLEAGAAGRAVVVTDVWGVADVVADTAVTAAVVPVDDPRALAEAIGQRLADPRLRHREAAALRTRVQQAHGRARTHDAVSALTVEVRSRRSAT